MEKIVTLKTTIETNSAFLKKCLTQEERLKMARILLHEIILSSTSSNYEAVGLLDAVKVTFLNNIELRRTEEKPKEKKRSSVISRKIE
jgi:hypothetical protein